MEAPFHPIANIFPMMSDAEYSALRNDIAANGLLEPVWFYEGKILDGRNRWRACKELGISPETKEYGGDDPVGFVVSMNLARRHLTSSQKAIIALEIEKALAVEAKERQREAGRLYGENHPQEEVSEIFQKPLVNKPIYAAEQAAKLVGTNPHYVHDAKNIEREAPELIPEIAAGNLSIPAAKKKLRKHQLAEERKALARKAESLPPSDRWRVEVADIRTYDSDEQFDFIITDPPYPREYLPLYEVLAERAKEWLKPNGLLVAMCGQSYLDKIYEMLSGRLVYYWTAAYLLPGQPTPLRHRQVNCSWKPILIYSPTEHYKGKIFGDVFQSAAPDKRDHPWQQSVSGMYSIISQICVPGQSIFDPFCGTGTTGVAALQHGCTFQGIDVDEKAVRVARGRLHDAEKK